jgi:hypothetical protein
MWLLAIGFGLFKYLGITLPIMLGNDSSFKEHLLALLGLNIGIVFNYWFLKAWDYLIKDWNNKYGSH